MEKTLLLGPGNDGKKNGLKISRKNKKIKKGGGGV